jgi:hypothetical protein
MALGVVSVEAVDHARLGYAERQPIPHIQLEGDVELGDKFLPLFGYVLFAIELDLEGELSHQRLMLAAGAPQSDVALSNYTFAKVQVTQRQQHLLHDASVHQIDFLVIGFLESSERREHSY